jgi:uncharacterized protein
MKRFIPLIFLAFIGCNQKQLKLFDYPITPVEISNVELSDSFWLPKIKLIQSTTIPHSFKKCMEEGRLENFLIAGGKMKGKVRGKMPFDDTDLYKIIEGASYSLISVPNNKLEITLDSIIDIIKIGQEPDGYLTTWFTIDPQAPPASWVKPSKERWENEISSHELYNSGHLFEAAVAHYQATKKKNFLTIAIRNADLLVQNFGPDKKHGAPGHQIVETGLIKLYRITKEKKYLELAKFFLDQRGDSTSRPLYGAYNQDHIPVIKQDEVVGHAVRAVYMYAGMTDIAAIYRDTTYLEAVNKLWENMVTKKMYITGGIGARHEGESFGNNYELPNLTAYNETCAAIGSVYWNHRLFMLTGNAKYFDVIERTLYNGLISGISLDGTTFFYPNPTESDGVYQFNMGACTRQPWFDCSCCPTNLIRFIPSIPGLIYASNEDSLYVNLFIASRAMVSLNNTRTAIIQKTDYPWKGKVLIEINPIKSEEFTLLLRIPGWTYNRPLPGDLYHYAEEDTMNVVAKINGTEQKLTLKNGYLPLTRKWIKGDQVELSIPMSVHRVITNQNVKDNIGQVALEYGPFVYCAEEIDNKNKLDKCQIPQNMTFAVEKQIGSLGKINVITGNPLMKDKPGKDAEVKMIFIPYYVWSNRGVEKMKVWFPSNK